MALQTERPIEVSTPLGEDVLLFRRMEASEELSRLFEYELELLSKNKAINLEDLIGQNITVRLNMRDDEKRYFNGYVSRFSHVGGFGEYAVYRATVRPWLWFLTRTSDCRIFQDISVPDIIKKICEEHGFSGNIEDLLSESYGEWTYCVQYRETDYNFLARLMEQEGIYFYFKHEDGKHKLVLADAHSSHELIPGYEEIPFFTSGDADLQDLDHMHEWSVEQEFQSCAYALNDFDFERPRSDVKVQAKVSHKHPLAELEIYDYPGEYCEPGAKAEKFATGDLTDSGKCYAESRIHELQCQYERVTGRGNARGLYAGGLFELVDCPREDQNREYLVIAASHALEVAEYASAGAGGGPAAEQTYSCRITAIDSKQAFRPPRVTPKPIVQGPQTAVVTGPSGEEIWTDQYGRVKVQFPWDRYGELNENSSCWVRVASVWAGKTWGGVQIPRIGQEVVVEFLEGDPDRPLITGRVYNGDNMPPYGLPDGATQSGIKSRSSKGGTGENFNEFRFEDKKGEEQLFLHAEKNQDIEVENDESHWVGHDRAKTVDNDEKTTIGRDRAESVGRNESISIGENRTENVGKDESITIGGNRTETVEKNETITISGARTRNVEKDEKVTISGSRSKSVAKDEKIAIEGDRTEQVAKKELVSVGEDRNHNVGKNDSLDVGKKLLINAGDEVTIKTGSASITMKKDGKIVIRGKDISLEASGKIDVKATSDVVIKGSKIGQN